MNYRSAPPKRCFLGEKANPSRADSDEVETRLLEWIRTMRAVRCMCVTSECLRVVLGRLAPGHVGNSSDEAVTQYLYRFRQRHGLTIRVITHRGTGMRDELKDVADVFFDRIRFIVEGNAFFPRTILSCDRLNHVFNMDQTSIYIDMTPRRTIEFRGARNVDTVQRMSINSFRASVFLCAAASGRKLRPFVVLAGARDAVGGVYHELLQLPLCDWTRGQFTAYQKAYCDERVMKEWIESVWKHEIRSNSLLLLESLKVHKMDTVKAVLEEECATLVEYIPAGVTGLCQSMDVAVMKAFKDRCRSLYVKSSIAHEFDTNVSAWRARIAHHIIQTWEDIQKRL